MLGVLPHEMAQCGLARLLHRSQEQNIRPLRSGLTGRRQVIGAVEEHGIDFLGVDEPRDLDRFRVVGLLDRLEVGVLDDHELALRDLPALHELVALDLAVVRRAPALLLDRREALTMQGAERHVGLPGGRFRRQGHSDRDVDQAEGDGAVPDGAHGASEL